ncbi:MAG: uncharacterized protein KVP18_003047 [Porospora cf. gigantea A]|uniref:uncharacterized protein n=1 Tax=Porospora cf. gigantea A TaxID=2853593 RepID=UPI00355A1CF6|nr:MAG: hypothetical protein KVP18_003047 [Porospora cf. gigantea A]
MRFLTLFVAADVVAALGLSSPAGALVGSIGNGIKAVIDKVSAKTSSERVPVDSKEVAKKRETDQHKHLTGKKTSINGLTAVVEPIHNHTGIKPAAEKKDAKSAEKNDAKPTEKNDAKPAEKKDVKDDEKKDAKDDEKKGAKDDEKDTKDDEKKGSKDDKDDEKKEAKDDEKDTKDDEKKDAKDDEKKGSKDH